MEERCRGLLVLCSTITYLHVMGDHHVEFLIVRECVVDKFLGRPR